MVIDHVDRFWVHHRYMYIVQSDKHLIDLLLAHRMYIMIMMKQKKNRHIVTNCCVQKGLFMPNGTESDIVFSECEQINISTIFIRDKKVLFWKCVPYPWAMPCAMVLNEICLSLVRRVNNEFNVL